MKQKKLFFTVVIIFLSILFFSCNRNNNANAAKENNANNTTASADASSASSTGDANFSCNINGASITGNGVDEMQLRNSAFLYPENTVLFDLVSTKNGEDQKPDYSVRIKCPAKTGTYTHVGDIEFAQATMPALYVDHLTGNFEKYLVCGVGASNSNKDTAIVTITSISNTRITGTFSASMRNENTPDGENKVIVTNGKFDIPFSTGNLRPE